MSRKRVNLKKNYGIPPRLMNIKLKLEEELRKLKERLEDNLLYEILDIKIWQIQPISSKKILEFPEITKITRKEDVDDKRQKDFNNLSNYIKTSLRGPLRRREKRRIEPLHEDVKIRKATQKIRRKYKMEAIDKKIEERIRKRIDKWREEHKEIENVIEENEKSWKTQINQQLEEVDDNLKKFYDVADFKVMLKWRVRNKEDVEIDLDPEEKNRKKGFFRKYIEIDSISLYSIEHGIIFDDFVPNIPMEINIIEGDIIESNKSNPEHSYTIPYTYEMYGDGWTGIWWRPWGRVLYERIKYNINVKYISDEKYADSTTPKTFEMIITFPCTMHKPYFWHIMAFPICCLGEEGGFWPGGLKWDAWGSPFKVKYTSRPDKDYYKGLGVDFFDGVRNRNVLSASFGISAYGAGVSLGVWCWWSEKGICNTNGSTGQNITINITPYLSIWGEYTGVFHAGGWLRVILNSITSEENKIREVGNIRFNIPLKLYTIQPFIVGVARKYVRSFYNRIYHQSADGKSELLNYVRYPGIPSPRYSTTVSVNPISSDQTTQICLKVVNLSTKVNLEDINIEIGNVDPYLRPTDGDYTKPNTVGEKVIAPQNQRQFCWTLQGNLTDRESIVVTPKFDITFRYGNPVPSHIGVIPDSIDGPNITINRV